jgi:hypothetical protein
MKALFFKLSLSKLGITKLSLTRLGVTFAKLVVWLAASLVQIQNGQGIAAADQAARIAATATATAREVVAFRGQSAPAVGWRAVAAEAATPQGCEAAPWAAA